MEIRIWTSGSVRWKIFVDGGFVKHKIPVKPIYITLRNLNTAVSCKEAALSVY
jgi:hypothetical protein